MTVDLRVLEVACDLEVVDIVNRLLQDSDDALETASQAWGERPEHYGRTVFVHLSTTIIPTTASVPLILQLVSITLSLLKHVRYFTNLS